MKEVLRLVVRPDAFLLATGRTFVGTVLATLGFDESAVEDVKLVVSDVMTGFLSSGAPVAIVVVVEDGSVEIDLTGEGGTAEVPTAVALPGAMTPTERGWRLILHAP